MISLQEFKALLSKVDESGRKLDEISEVLGGADKLCEAACTDEVIRLLEMILDDRDGDISYWVWELDFGRKWKPGCVTDSDGTDIKLETAEDLYHYLTSNLNDGSSGFPYMVGQRRPGASDGSEISQERLKEIR